MTDPGSAKPRRMLTANKAAEPGAAKVGAKAADRAGTGARTGPRAKLAQQRAVTSRAEAPPAPAPGPAQAPGPARAPRPATRDEPRRAPQARPHPEPHAASRTQPPAKPGAIRYFAPCPRGLEQPLQAELGALGIDDARIVAGGVQFSGDAHASWRVNLCSRIASRVLQQVAHFPYRDENDIYAKARAFDWPARFHVECTIKVEIAARNSPLHSLEFTALRIKDAVCDAFREATGARPDVNTSRPDVRIHAFFDERDATLYLDTSGEALFKRGWRHGAVDAPLRENLAAGLLALSGWQPGLPLIDPFCGSGTLAIEAAQIAQRRAPGAWRHFSFERFNEFDATAWDAMRAQTPRDETPLPIFASDVSQEAVDIARGNAKRAGAPIDVRIVDARAIAPPDLGPDAVPGLVIGNPPYGERAQFLDANGAQIDAGDFWRGFGENLKQHWAGWRLALISSDVDLPKRVNLSPTRKLPLYNGALECRLFVFAIGPKRA